MTFFSSECGRAFGFLCYKGKTSVRENTAERFEKKYVARALVVG